jgi:3',5'-cyclic-AMP phosphodiesterase
MLVQLSDPHVRADADDHGAAAAFGAPGAAGKPLNYAVRCGPLRLVACDTKLPDGDGGAIGPEGLAWLDATLAEEPAVPTVLAMHHPPMLTGMPAMDQIALEDRAALAELLRAHAQVRTVIAGHVHRAVAGRVGPCPVFVCPSVHLTLVLDLRPEAEPPVTVVDEPPAFAIHVLADGEVASHVQPIGDFGPSRPFP